MPLPLQMLPEDLVIRGAVGFVGENRLFTKRRTEVWFVQCSYDVKPPRGVRGRDSVRDMRKGLRRRA